MFDHIIVFVLYQSDFDDDSEEGENYGEEKKQPENAVTIPHDQYLQLLQRCNILYLVMTNKVLFSS